MCQVVQRASSVTAEENMAAYRSAPSLPHPSLAHPPPYNTHSPTLQVIPPYSLTHGSGRGGRGGSALMHEKYMCVVKGHCVSVCACMHVGARARLCASARARTRTGARASAGPLVSGSAYD